jgi:hypothetical protein
MNVISILLMLVNGYNTYASTILAVVSGLGMILSKNYQGGFSELFQALTLIFGATSVVGLRHAVAKLEGCRQVGLRHAVAGRTPGGSNVENSN